MREPRLRRLLSAVAIFLSALALQRACTLAWGRGVAAGSHVHLTVMGLTRRPASADRPVVDCRWWPRYGDATLCAVSPGATAAAGRLRAAYPLLQVGLWLSVASMFLQALRVPRSRAAQAALPALVAALTVAAVLFVRQGAAAALAALDGIPMHLSGAGFVAAIAAAVLAAASAALLATTPPRGPST